MVSSGREAQIRDRGPLCSTSLTDGVTEARDGQQPLRSPGKRPSHRCRLTGPYCEPGPGRCRDPTQEQSPAGPPARASLWAPEKGQG